VAGVAAAAARAQQAAVDQRVLDVDDLHVAPFLTQDGTHVVLDRLFHLLGELVRRQRRPAVFALHGRGQGDLGERLAPRRSLAPGFVEQVLQSARHVVARHASPAGLVRAGDFGNGAEVQLADLTPDVGLGEREALAYHTPVLLLVGVNVDAQLGQVHAAFLGPIEHGRFQGLGPHHRTVDLLLRQPAEEVDNVLVADLEGLERRVPPLLQHRG